MTHQNAIHLNTDMIDDTSLPPSTPQSQSSEWKAHSQSHNPHSTPRFQSNLDTVSLENTPNSPESPFLPLSPISPTYSGWPSLDSQIQLASLDSPQQLSPAPSRPYNGMHMRAIKKPISKVGELTLGKIVGSGSFSQTYQAFASRSVFAVKQRLTCTSSALFAHECSILTKLMSTNTNESKHVVQFFPELSESDYLVFTLYSSNLDQVVRSPRFQIDPDSMEFFDFKRMIQPSVPFDRWCDWAAQLKSGLKFIHSQNIVHSDIKPDNVLVSANDQLVIADFSGAINLDTETTSPLTKDLANGLAWSPVYTDPDVRSQRASPSFGSDIFALGLVLAFMATGQEPYASAKNTTQRLLWMDKIWPLDSFETDLQPKLSRVRPLIDRCLQRSFAGFDETLAMLSCQ